MVVNDARDFGRQIRMRRKSLGITQKELAEFTGFSVSFISDLERGKETAELGKTIFLANTIGLDLSLHERGE